MTEPLRVLFVCTANICRSPFMEVYARSVVADAVHVYSAGTYGLDAEPMSSEMVVELEARGLTADTFRSRAITASLIETSDLVITAERVHRQFILDEYPEAFRKVLTLGQAVRASQAIDDSTRGSSALPHLARHRGVAEPDDDVADPFRRGPAAAAAAASQITAMLDQFLPVLTSDEETTSMDDLITTTFFAILAAGFIVGIVVGLTGMGGGALMTPALIFLGVGDAATVVTADLTAAAVYKTGGAIVHQREGSPNLQLAKWLIIGSVPMALLGPYLIAGFTDPDELDDVLKLCIGFALLFAALTYALRLYVNLLRVRGGGPTGSENPAIRPIPTLLVGALGGLLVGITSVGSGSVIMISLLMLYPGLAAVKLVGTDLVQAVPLVLAAAISNIAIHGLDWGILIPLILGSVPGTLIGSKIAPRVPQSFIRRGIVVVLTMSGVALLDKAGWAPLGAGEDETYPMLIAGVGLATLILVPLVWGLIRRTQGLPMFGAPTVAQLEDPSYRPGIVGMKRQE